MTVNNRLESQPSPKAGSDAPSAGESSALTEFSVHLNVQPPKGAVETLKNTDQSKIPEERLFLERLEQISLSAEKDTCSIGAKAKAAWDKLFQPNGFNENRNELAPENLSLEKNIYS